MELCAVGWRGEENHRCVGLAIKVLELGEKIEYLLRED